MSAVTANCAAIGVTDRAQVSALHLRQKGRSWNVGQRCRSVGGLPCHGSNHGQDTGRGLPNAKCLENAKTIIEGSYVRALIVIPDGPEKDKGIALGKATAEAVLAKRANDNADTGGPYINKTCPPPAAPGKYQCTPDRPFVAFEKWESVTPFVLKDHTEFRPGPPYKVDDAKFKADLEEVKKLGGDGKAMPTTRTPEQAEIGLFWLESSPLKWGRIAQTVATDKKLDLWDSARLLAIMQMGQADGYLAMVSAKNHYQFWRPVTAIRASGDASWTPFQNTPPIKIIRPVTPSKVVWEPRYSSGFSAPIR